ncbi:MAG: DUF1549 domain-containing protein, partial [Planctomycetales bacterium]
MSMGRQIITCAHWILAGFALSSVGLAESPVERIDFHRDIKPLLSDRCFNCHGPDENARQADLNLSDKQAVLSYETDSGIPLITAGDLNQSEIIRRIESADPDLQMPPPDQDRTLSQEEINRLRRWIEQGAPWESHWSLMPLNKVAVPDVQDSNWTSNPIDHFVLDRLEQQSLQPSDQASRQRLVRRLSLDLTGLPPTLAEIDAFVADSRPESDSLLIDRLLASPHFGERMAVDWLDLARYADTAGYQIDRYREVWPWRDWVVQSFNSNMPFDQFTIEQLAGDLLPG